MLSIMRGFNLRIERSLPPFFTLNGIYQVLYLLTPLEWQDHPKIHAARKNVKGLERPGRGGAGGWGGARGRAGAKGRRARRRLGGGYVFCRAEWQGLY